MQAPVSEFKYVWRGRRKAMDMDEIRSEITGVSLDAGSLRPLDSDQSILALLVPGEDATNAWQRLVEIVPKTGRWPIICGDADEASFEDALQFEKRTPSEILS